jgi:hypothetical protein
LAVEKVDRKLLGQVFLLVFAFVAIKRSTGDTNRRCLIVRHGEKLVQVHHGRQCLLEKTMVGYGWFMVVIGIGIGDANLLWLRNVPVTLIAVINAEEWNL